MNKRMFCFGGRLAAVAVGVFLVQADAVGVSAAAVSPLRAEQRTDAEALLARWCDGLVAHQLDYPNDRGLNGAMVCSACAYLHGRIGDTVYPLVVLWDRTGDGKYLAAARKAIGWCEANTLNADGSYMNDLKTPWNYITVFSQIAIGKTLRAYGPKLPDDFRARLDRIYARQSRWLFDCFRRPKTVASVEVNYWGNQAEAMAEAGAYLRTPAYVEEARRIVATRLRPLFTADGLLAGEVVPADVRSRVRGLAAVDLGYNLEETLPAMLAAAEALGDGAFEAQVVSSARAHLEFLLPDGAIDDTAGSRGYKWTYAGSRTTDGVLPLLAKLERRGVGWARRAAARVIALHARLTGDDGLLYGGLHYRDAQEPACIHQTFTHAKGLAEYVALQDGQSPRRADEPLPRERTDRVVNFPSMGVDLAAVGPWRATFSVSDAYVLPGEARRLTVGGGSPTLLWHERAGLLLAATQAEFFFLETTNQQETRRERDILSTTPRLETADGFSSVQDFDVAVTSGLAEGVFSYCARGTLTSLRGEKGAPFEARYQLSRTALSIRVKADVACRYQLPIVGGDETEIVVSGRSATIRRGATTFALTASSPLQVRRTERGVRAFTTIGGLMTTQLFAEIPPGEEAVFDLKEMKR